jgi:predicted RNA-binding Zn-ribbon protein involved in translation (DUF1610 family)
MIAVMTIETINTIEPRDITAVEFSCKACGAKMIRKIDAKFNTPIKCGNCPSVWFIAGRPEILEMDDFIRMLERYSKNEFPYILRLQVPNEKSA